jgi:hypothetical protein
LVVTGGVGVSGNIYVGGNINADNIVGTLNGNFVGNIVTSAQPNITSTGTLTLPGLTSTANIALTDGNWIVSNTSGNLNLKDLNILLVKSISAFNTNNAVTDTVVLDAGNLQPQTIGISMNANVTLSFSSTITAGYTRKTFYQNYSGATRQIVLPNSVNNKGTATILIANGITASFTYTALDSTSANVAVFVANN